jgi:hypothetical protein
MIDKQKLVKIVGTGKVSDREEDLETYSSDISFVNRVRPAYVVKPGTASEVQKLIELANSTKTPLVPVSSGAPHFKGDTVPGNGGSIIVDLSGMKKVEFVDRARRVAMVEPGVTFEELIPLCTKEGLRLNMPLLPRKTKSVMGSILEREPVLMPGYQWDMSDPLACAGFILVMVKNSGQGRQRVLAHSKISGRWVQCRRPHTDREQHPCTGLFRGHRGQWVLLHGYLLGARCFQRCRSPSSQHPMILTSSLISCHG